MHFIKILLIFIFSMNLHAVDKLLTKQSINNIRYISSDGKFTYYQKHSGVLSASTNYAAFDLLKYPTHTQYSIVSSKSRKNLAIEVNDTFHKTFNMRKNNKIIVSKIGSKEHKFIGEGVSPLLHLDDSWITYFDPLKKNIHAQNIFNPTQKIQIKIKNPINPYFIPTVYIPMQGWILYTDINEDGVTALLGYEISTNSVTPIYKSQQSGTKIEVCKTKKSIFFGIFPYANTKRGSLIFQFPIEMLGDTTSYKQIYSSAQDDIGNLVCVDDSVYFIKVFEVISGINYLETDVVLLKDKKIIRQTHLKRVTQLINMDGRILAPYRGDYYVIHGQNYEKKDSLGSEKKEASNE